MKVPLSGPSITQREIDLVTQVLRTGVLSLGDRLTEFEEKFAAYADTRFAIAVNSGTSALHLCVRALDIGPEDEVITTSFSFVASANCLLYEGALPAFVDIAPETLNIDPQKIARFLKENCTRNTGDEYPLDRATGRRVKAILPVHVFGLPCDMEQICAIAQEYGLAIIEDACEALGAHYQNRPVGTFGKVGAFAFYPNKQMTTAEGGIVVTNDPQIAEACRSMRNQGRNEGSSWLQHSRLGYNYRLSELHCALGIAQLERVQELLERRAEIAALYDKNLSGQSSLILPSTPPDRTRSWFVYVVQLNGDSSKERRDRIMLELRERGIGSQAYFPAIHRQPYFKRYITSNLASSLHQTDFASDRCLALPFFPAATREDIEYVCETLFEILEHDLKTEKLYLSA